MSEPAAQPLADMAYLRFVLHAETDGILMTRKKRAPLAVNVPESEEIHALLQVMVDRGAHKIRITGDDPILREDLPDVVRMAAGLPGIQEVGLTTRAMGMSDRVSELAKAGLDSVNVDLDTLKRSRYKKLTGQDEFDSVWNGIQEALGAGIAVKVNCVLQAGVNDDEIDQFVALTADQPIDVRFVEWNTRADRVAPPERFVPTWDAIAMIKPRLLHKEPEPFGGPAVLFEIPGHLGSIGFIPNVTEHFCSTCDRIGLTDFGEIVSCIFGRGLNLIGLLRSPGADASVDAFVDRVLRRKTSLAAKLGGWASVAAPAVAVEAQ